MRWLFLPLGCALLYALALSGPKPVDLLVGAGLGLAIAAVLRGPSPGPVAWLTRLAWSPVLVVGILVQIGSGLATVGARILGLRTAARSGLVDVPIGERSDTGAVASALVATLSPGSLLVRIDRERGVLRFHVIDASDPEAFRRRQQEFYRRYQRRAIP